MISWNVDELSALTVTLSKADKAGMQLAAVEIKNGGEAVKKRAKQLAPRRTGALQRSIQATYSGGPGGLSPSVEIGPSVRHGRYVEHGTAGMKAEPFLAPAVDQLADEIAGNIAEAIARGVLG